VARRDNRNRRRSASSSTLRTPISVAGSMKPALRSFAARVARTRLQPPRCCRGRSARRFRACTAAGRWAHAPLRSALALAVARSAS
jgi:hypothetical protein